MIFGGGDDRLVAGGDDLGCTEDPCAVMPEGGATPLASRGEWDRGVGVPRAGPGSA